MIYLYVEMNPFISGHVLNSSMNSYVEMHPCIYIFYRYTIWIKILILNMRI